MPVRLEGLGIRSTLETRHAAFIEGVEQALSHFTTREGVWDQLNPLIGDLEAKTPSQRDSSTLDEELAQS